MCKNTTIKIGFIYIVLLGIQVPSLPGAAIKDTESATHGADASQYQIVDTYAYPGFKLIQINLPVMSHYSYILASDGQALLVDPGRDIQFYLDTVRQQNLKITGLYLTHSHADFVAGHMEVVEAAQCPIYQSAKSKAEYPITAVAEGTVIKVGQATVKSIDTPGHVVDGTSALVYGPGQDQPELMLSGDYLFVGSVGRPDLVVGTTSAALAGLAFDTWHDKVSKLPDTVRVFPAHGAGSLCGAHLRDAPFTTIGEERVSNPYMQYRAKAEFVTAVLSDLSEPPQYFGHNAAMNRVGPPLVEWTAVPEKLPPDRTLTQADQVYVADVRDAQAYAEGHIPNSVNIGLRGRFETWTGMMVPWDSHLVLCGEDAELQEAVHRLHRVGYTGKAVSYSDWQKSGLALNKNVLMPPAQLYEAMQNNTEPIIVDVRLPNEWMGLRIGTVLNLPLNKLAQLSAKLNKEDPVVAVCNSAYRSTLAIGVLERMGFTQVTSLAGGSEAWIEAGYPVYGAETHAGAAAIPRKVVPLPERICANELNRMLLDLPGTFDLVDIRPPAMFADYSLPGSVNVDIADLIGNPAYLTGAGPLVIVDRDGSLAMAVGGILSQKTQRLIKAVYGGLEAYWSQNEIPASGATAPILPSVTTPIPTRPMPMAPPAPAAPVQQPTRPTKKSAGC
jgi:rhodanese-related sulfurtransferase